MLQTKILATVLTSTEDRYQLKSKDEIYLWMNSFYVFMLSKVSGFKSFANKSNRAFQKGYHAHLSSTMYWIRLMLYKGKEHFKSFVVLKL